MSEIDYKMVPLFSTPLFVKHGILADESTKNFLINQNFERMFSNNGDYGVDKYILNKPECTSLKDKLNDAIKKYAYIELRAQENIKFYITNSWVVRHKPGDWAQDHVHTNCILSGVYYFDVTGEGDCGEFTLTREVGKNGVFPHSCDIDVRDWNLFNSKIWTMIPQNGDVYMFPSSTIHNVSKNKTNNDRHSLAFNVHVKGKLGTKEFELDIK